MLPNDPRGWITPEPLNVAPELIGLPLAAPKSRLVAMALDLAVIALLSGVSGFWLVGGLALVVLQLRSQRGVVTGRRQVVGWMGAALLALLAFGEVRTHWAARHEPPAASVPAADDVATPAAGQAASAARAAASAPSDAERIAALQAELAEARKPRPTDLREDVERQLQAIGLKFGWGIVYFSLLPAWWGGQTVGKKVFGLKVIELTGQPMTVMRCLKRYGGYAAGMATGGLGFLQLLWDANRQAIQDKTAHTVVIDLRAPRRDIAAGTVLP